MCTRCGGCVRVQSAARDGCGQGEPRRALRCAVPKTATRGSREMSSAPYHSLRRRRGARAIVVHRCRAAAGARRRTAARPAPPTGIVVPPLGAGPFVYQTAEGQDIRVVVHTRGLVRPWSLVWLPSGEMLVTERGGQLRIVRDGMLDPQPIAGVPEVRAQGLSGLFDVALHPQFATNRFVYLSYNKPIARAAERPRRRARRVERPRADRRARHLRDDGREQRLAARIRPRRQALRQHVRQRRRRQRRAESHEPSPARCCG